MELAQDRVSLTSGEKGGKYWGNVSVTEFNSSFNTAFFLPVSLVLFSWIANKSCTILKMSNCVLYPIFSFYEACPSNGDICRWCFNMPINFRNHFQMLCLFEFLQTHPELCCWCGFSVSAFFLSECSEAHMWLWFTSLFSLSGHKLWKCVAVPYSISYWLKLWPPLPHTVLKFSCIILLMLGYISKITVG